MFQSKCFIPGCDRPASDFYKRRGYCLGHYLVVKILDVPDTDYLKRQPRPGPTESKKEKQDA